MPQSKRQQKSAEINSEKRYIPIPDDFKGPDGEKWTFSIAGEQHELELPEILGHTARFCRPRQDNPAPGDCNRLLGFCDSFYNADGLSQFEMSRNDFDWMVKQFTEHGHKVWNPVDNAYLVRWLERNVKASLEEVEELRMV